MSQAFVREEDNQWLHEIPPTITALINYLTRENNGVRVYEKSTSINPEDGKTVYLMSNGISYAIDKDSKWYVFD